MNERQKQETMLSCLEADAPRVLTKLKCSSIIQVLLYQQHLWHNSDYQRKYNFAFSSKINFLYAVYTFFTLKCQFQNHSDGTLTYNKVNGFGFFPTLPLKHLFWEYVSLSTKACAHVHLPTVITTVIYLQQ